jgi:acetyl esterase/lipase
MAIISQALSVLGATLAVVLLLWTALLYVPFRWRPVGIYLFGPKVAAVALAPLIAMASAALAAGGAAVGWWWIAAPAAVAMLGAAVVTARLGAAQVDLAGALGSGWEERIPVDRRCRMIGRWWVGRLRRDPEPRWERDVAFATVPGTDRTLLCDVWQPPSTVRPSGLALVFLHGSGYYVFDKDFLTRRLFRHLTADGYVIVDVAYRLFPETDVAGMVGDAKRAVAWVRDHAGDLGVDPDRIVIAGGSSGGHLALLAGYSHEQPGLTPPELAGSDPAVCGVISLYGQVHLAAMYDHVGQVKVTRRDDPMPDWDAPPPPRMVRLFGDDARRLRLQFMSAGGRCDWLMGGTPAEVPDRYELVSALHYVHHGCPPTLLMHGRHDEMAPVSAVRDLKAALDIVGAPVAAVYLPHADHMFDVGVGWSPAARVAVHVLERFLAVLAADGRSVPVEAGAHQEGGGR